MSQENVGVVRGYNAAHEGGDVIPPIREALDRLGPDPEPDAVLAVWAAEPAMQHLHADIEWDVAATGAIGTSVRGPTELWRWWADWVEGWESYVYRMREYRSPRLTCRPAAAEA